VWALALAALHVVGCSSPSEPPRPSSPVTLRVGFALPKVSTGAGGGVNSFLINQVYDSMIGLGWDGRPTRDRTISDWTWSPDQLELTLTLRPGIQFHDGTPIDQTFFRDSLERLIKESRETQAKRSPSMRTVISFDSITSVSAVGTDKVVIKLSQPEAFLLNDISLLSLMLPGKPDVGFGPYRVTSREPKARLAAFDKYYRGRPEIDVIEVEQFEEQRGSWAALMRGDIDAVHEITPGAIDFPQGQVFPFTRPYYIQLLFNIKHPQLKNPVVRQALSYAVNRQALIDSGLNRQGTVADGPIWPFHWAYSTAQKTYRHNSEAATLRLESAGLKIKPSKQPGGMPSRLQLRCLTVEKDTRYEKIALVLQKQMYEIGIDMRIEALPLQELAKRLQAQDYDTILIERTSGRSLAWTYLTFHSAGPEQSYSAADAVLDGLRRTTDEAKIRTAVSDLQQILFDDPPAIFIAWPTVARVVSTKFVVRDELGTTLTPSPKGVGRDDKGRDIMNSLWRWRLAEPPR
jgi:peptide/nickel transport system substrate-binding protein